MIRHLQSKVIWPGRPFPLGATWDGRGVNFALFSADAEKVELCLFDARGRKEETRIVLPDFTDGVWHGYLPDARPGLLYGYRVYGPYQPEQGLRFNHHKLLIDPYAKKLFGRFRWTDAHFGYRITSSRGDLSFDIRNNARSIPKCVVVDTAFTHASHWRPRTPWSETVIYEAHLRGFTMRHPAIPVDERGCFAGMSHQAIIGYLKALGITAIELLPIQAFVDERFLVKKSLTNYWGYNTLNFFAPEPRYMSTDQLTELKTMVMRLHDAGIEVILDVVYNHTAEGDHFGPTLSFRGIDNRSYYRLNPENPRYYLNYSGCGNSLNLNNSRVLQMVMDSLRYWVQHIKIDGFRFDLAVSLGRTAEGFDPNGGFFAAIRQDPILAGVKLIAEPWDVGPGGYQLGSFPSGWSEWNDRSRDTIRRFWMGYGKVGPELARRLHGSADLFEHAGRHPWASVNYVACHDGFTLMDQVSYEHRRNHANGEENRDGHHHEISTNCGFEGASEDKTVQTERTRLRRNLLATVLLCQGTPMVLAGDELGHSQAGNNNAYCQDNELTWMNWDLEDGEDRAFLEFTRQMIRLRREHPVLRRAFYVHGQSVSAATGFTNIQWVHPEDRAMMERDWQEEPSICFGMLLAGDANNERPRQGKGPHSETVLVIFNPGKQEVPFVLPNAKVPVHWRLLADTAEADPTSWIGHFEPGFSYHQHGCSLSVFSLGYAEALGEGLNNNREISQLNPQVYRDWSEFSHFESERQGAADRKGRPHFRSKHDVS